MKKCVLTILSSIVFVHAFGAIFTASTSGNWNLGTTWGGVCASGCIAGVDFPGSSDSTIIPAGRNVTIPSNFYSANTKGLNIQAGGFLTLNWSLNVRGNMINNGSMPFAVGKLIFLNNAGSTISGTGTWNYGDLYFQSNRTITAGTVITKYNGYVYIFGGTVLTNNGTLTLNPIAVNGTTAASTIFQGATGVLNVRTATFMTTGVLNATTAGNTVTFNKTSGGQSIKTPVASTYYNLSIAGAGTKTMGASLIVLGNLTITSSFLNFATFNLNIGGNWINTAGTNCTNMGNVTFDGSGAQTITRSTTEIFNGLTVASTGTVTLGGDIRTNGALTISSGTLDVSISDFGIDCRSGFAHTGGTFAPQNGTVTFAGSTAQTISGGVNTQFANILVNDAAGVSLTGAKSLTGTLTMAAGNFNTNGSEFTLISSALGTARVETVPPTCSLLGSDWVIQRRIPGPTVAYWDYLTCPTANKLDRWDAVTSPTRFYMSGTGGDDGNACCPTFYSVRRFNEPTNAYVNITTQGHTLVRGRGYMVWVGSNISSLSGDLLFDSKGSVVSTDQSIAVTFGAGGGYNLIGNPMPSQILWSSVFAASSSLSNQFLILDETLGGYATWDGSTSSGTGQLAGSGGVINSTQGFMIQCTAGTTVNIPELAKTSFTTGFVRLPDALNVLKVKLSSDANTYGAESMIAFTEQASDASDVQDLPFLASPYEGAPQLKIVSGDGKELLNSSVSTFSNSHVIPVKVKATVPGNYTLAFNGIENLLSKFSCAYLKDVMNGTFIDLKNETSVTFLVADVNEERVFELYFDNETPGAESVNFCKFADITTETALENNVNIYSNEQGINIVFGFDEPTPAVIRTYNALGQEVMPAEKVEAEHNTLIFGEALPKGLYIVHVEANGKILVKKIIK